MFIPINFIQSNEQRKNGENLIISPLSIFQSLSLAANGAKGKTLSEMLDLLQSDSLDELNELNYQFISTFSQFSTIDIANAVMTRFTPLDNFTIIAKKYLAPIDPLESVDQVNNWCSNKTHGKINHIIDELAPNVLMFILNEIYFKGEWSVIFNRISSIKLPFYNLGKEEVQIDTMKQISDFKYYENKKDQAIELQFKQDYMSAIIILPSEGTDINKYINTLSLPNNEYNQIIQGLKFSKVDIQLPKFEIEFNEKLNEILKDLGMYDAFSPDYADFSSIKKEQDLYISHVIHKTYLIQYTILVELRPGIIYI